MNPITASDYHDIAVVSDPQLSPDGESVVFVQTVIADGEHAATIRRVPLRAGEPEIFTASRGVDSEPRFSPSGDRLAFTSTRVADSRPQLWVMSTDGGEARQVTDVPGGVSSISWSPDGNRIAFTQRSTVTERQETLDCGRSNGDGTYERELPDPRVIDRLVYRSHEERWFDGTRRHVYVADLDDDAVRRLTDGDTDYAAPEWGDEATLYYAVRCVGDPDDSLVYDVDARDTETGKSERVTRTTGHPTTIAATGDGRVAFPHTPGERASLRQNEVHVHDRETDETHVPTESVDRTNGAFQWGPDQETLYVETPDEGTVAVRRVRWDGDGSDHEVVLGGDHVEAFDVGDGGVAFVRSGWDHPGDVFVATRDGAEQDRLTRVNGDELDGRAVPEPEEVRFEHDGVEIQGWVLTPPEFDPDEEYPLVVEIHGGPHLMWSASGKLWNHWPFWHEFQTLAARGYVVFWCNPRGSVGYGEEFMAAVERSWGPVTMGDIMAGVDRIAQREYVGEDLFVTGGSFGGYMTGWIVGHTDRFDGAVAQRGVYDLTGFYGGTDVFKLIEHEFDTPWESPDRLWEHSPIAHAHEATTPTLVLHAEDDYRAPISGGETFYRLLRKSSVETRFVRYPGEGHDLPGSGKPAHIVDRIERICRWFDGYSDHRDVPPAVERDPDADLSS